MLEPAPWQPAPAPVGHTCTTTASTSARLDRPSASCSGWRAGGQAGRQSASREQSGRRQAARAVAPLCGEEPLGAGSPPPPAHLHRPKLQLASAMGQAHESQQAHLGARGLGVKAARRKQSLRRRKQRGGGGRSGTGPLLT